MNGDLSQIVNKIMSNPEFGNLVNDLKNSDILSNSGENGGSTGNISSEDIMKKLPEVMEKLNLSPNSGNDGKSANESSIDAVKIDKAVNAIKKMDNQKCEKLLSALKPYLSRERGEVIDKAMSVMKITDILGTIQDVVPSDKNQG